jgi:TfoX/Sxy family transcriptional regulator of competence genes
MAYDTKLATRVRAALDGWEDVEERSMFGGLAFLVRGHMCCGVLKDMLVLRLGAAGAEAALARPHTKAMDFTGKPVSGMIYVLPAGVRTAVHLQRWLEEAFAFCSTLPDKAPAKQFRPQPMTRKAKRKLIKPRPQDPSPRNSRST